MSYIANCSWDYQAGDEGTWLKDNMAFFQEQIDIYDDDEFRDMVKEIYEREDLRKLVDLE